MIVATIKRTWLRVVHVISLMCCEFVCCVCLHPMSCAQCCLFLWKDYFSLPYSVFSNVPLDCPFLVVPSVFSNSYLITDVKAIA